MSNLWINLRIGLYYLQIGPGKPYVSFRKGLYYTKDNKPKKFLEIY